MNRRPLTTLRPVICVVETIITGPFCRLGHSVAVDLSPCDESAAVACGGALL